MLIDLLLVGGAQQHCVLELQNKMGVCHMMVWIIGWEYIQWSTNLQGFTQVLILQFLSFVLNNVRVGCLGDFARKSLGIVRGVSNHWTEVDWTGLFS